MLSDAAARRLVLYCERSAGAPRESVERRYGRGTRGVPYTNRQLRQLVWADREVREALLQEFGALAELLRRRGHDRRFGDLLDLMTAMSLEAENCEHPRPDA
jgi:hypothetical protein